MTVTPTEPHPASPPPRDRATAPRPRVAVWKFSSCDGCQLSILSCEDDLLAIADAVEFAYFLEATSAVQPGPYTVSIVEGSVTTPSEVDRIQRIREESAVLIAIGACATGGGIQALRNFADVREYTSIVYARPDYIATLDTSTPISDHVTVDLELRGCPIDQGQLVQVISDLLAGRDVAMDSEAVCIECKQRGNTCVMVARGKPCLGPVTHAGCGALCPSFDRGCFGCFGPADTTNTASLTERLGVLGMTDIDIERVFHTFAAATPEFRDVGRGTGAEAINADEADSGTGAKERQP